jgi:hypothetical protein
MKFVTDGAISKTFVIPSLSTYSLRKLIVDSLTHVLQCFSLELDAQSSSAQHPRIQSFS